MVISNMKKIVLTLVTLWTFNLVYAQTTSDFFGIPMMRDFKASAKVLEEKGLEVVSAASDSVLLVGSLDLFGECQVILREICQKVSCRNNEGIDNALKERYGEPNISEEGHETYYVSEYSVASISRDSAFTNIIVLDLADMFTIKFKGVALGAPLEDILPQLEKDSEYVMTYEGYTILKGRFAGFYDCTIYIDAANDDDVVSVINVYFPQTDNWNTLLSQYKELKEALTEKYGEPEDCIEKNIKHKYKSNVNEVYGYKPTGISQLIKGKIDCHAIFKPSILGEIKLSLVGYEDSNTGAVSLMYCDLLSLKKKTESADEDL